MTHSFKLPRRLFQSYVEYLKYSFGILKPSREEVLRQISELLSKELGLKKIYKFLRFGNDFPRVIAYEGQHAEFTVYGSDLNDYAVAQSKMLGEFLERKIFKTKQFSGFEASLTLRELKELYGIHVCSDFHNYSALNKSLNPRTNIDSNFKLASTQVEDMLNKKKVFYPSQCIFYDSIEDKEPFRLAPRNSTGCAGGFTVEEATFSAICEIIERDAFLLFWLLRIPAREIMLEKGGFPEFEKKIDDFLRYGFSIKFYDITSDMEVPTVLAVMADELSKEKKAVVSASTGATFVQAFGKTLSEASLVAMSFNGEGGWQDVHDLIRKGKFVDTFGPKHRSKVLYKNNVEILDFLKNAETVNLGTLNATTGEENLDSLVRKLKDRKFSVYRFVSQEGILRDIGYSAVRVIIPQLLPFYMEEKLSMNDSERVVAHAKRYGLQNPVLNLFPHPFP